MAIPPAAAALAGCSRFGIGGVASDPIVEDLKEGDVTGFPGAVRFDDRYAMEVARGTDSARGLSGRFHRADRVLEFAAGRDGKPVTAYVVDGDRYVVTAGECIEYPGVASGPESVAGFDSGDASTGADDAELAVTGETTVDERETLVFEPVEGAPAETEQPVTYYADAETRYLRRIEAGVVTVDYHSWTGVEPIEAPTGDCRQGETASSDSRQSHPGFMWSVPKR